MGIGRASILAVLAPVVLLIGLEGCATVRKPAAPSGRLHSKLEAAGITRRQARREVKLEEIYNKAIVDSAVFRADHQVSDLRQVTSQNVPVVMSSFVSCEGCSCGPNQAAWCSRKCCLGKGTQTFPSDVWVAFSDQVYQFCSRFPRQDVPLRMQQLLGLPPQLEQPLDSWKFLVLRITSPNQLFRPCADPDPTTPGPCAESFPASASTAHQAWIAGQAFFAWQQYDDDPSKGGYPWTRLGYTYNWNPDASIVGASEFVIPGGTQVEVCGVVPATEFCAAGGDPKIYCSASK